MTYVRSVCQGMRANASPYGRADTDAARAFAWLLDAERAVRLADGARRAGSRSAMDAMRRGRPHRNSSAISMCMGRARRKSSRSPSMMARMTRIRRKSLMCSSRKAFMRRFSVVGKMRSGNRGQCAGSSRKGMTSVIIPTVTASVMRCSTSITMTWRARMTFCAALPAPCPRLYRAPNGFHTPWSLRAVGEHGLRAIGWDVESNDWDEPGVDTIVMRTVDHVQPGSIILLHDGDNTRLGTDRSQQVAAVRGHYRNTQSAGLSVRHRE